MNITVHMTADEFDDYRLFRRYKRELITYLKQQKLREASLKPVSQQKNDAFKNAVHILQLKIADADIPSRAKNALLLNQFPKDMMTYGPGEPAPQGQMRHLEYLRDLIGMRKEHFIRCRNVYNKAWADLLHALEKYNIHLDDFTGRLVFGTTSEDEQEVTTKYALPIPSSTPIHPGSK